MSRWRALMLALVAIGSGAAGVQQRDVSGNRVVAPIGTASISGTVVTDDPQKRPLRRVTVTLSDTSRPDTRSIATDDEGRFLLAGIAPGRYQLSAAKAAYLTTIYGSKGPPRATAAPLGISLVITEGQHVSNVTIALVRGAVLVGTLRDPNGRPAAAVRVAVAYYGRLPNGERTFFDATSAITDDLGAYRIYGLAPGDYVLYAMGPVLVSSDEVLTTTLSDIQRAESVLAGRATQAPSAAVPRHETTWFSSTYFPGTVVVSDATAVSVVAGEVREGLDFQMQLVPTARVEGTVYGENGQPSANLLLQLVSQGSTVIRVATATTDAQGRYRFVGVQPSSYSIVTRLDPVGRSVDQSALSYFGSADINVRGNDVRADLQLQPSRSISGRTAYDGSVEKSGPDLARVRITVTPVTTNLMLAPRVLTIERDGSFVATGLAPGSYRLAVTTSSNAASPPIFLKSAVFGGQDVLDTMLDLRSGRDFIGGVLTFTQRTADITGRVVDAQGAPGTDYVLVAFSADPSYWGPMSRRIQQVRPARDGSFAFVNLPPGDYLISAVTEIEQGQCFDPDFLRLLLPGATKLTLAEGEKKVQDLRVGIP